MEKLPIKNKWINFCASNCSCVIDYNPCQVMAKVPNIELIVKGELEKTY